ncbi:MAG: caspase family protein [Flavobacteriales bacterium]
MVSTGHHAGILSLTYSNDGKYMASGGDDFMVKIYDLGLKQEFNSLPGHTSGVFKVQFSPDRKFLYSVSNKEAFTWEFPSCKLVHRTQLAFDYDGNGYDLHISDAGLLFWPCNSDGLYVYDLAKGDLKNHYPDLAFHNIVYLEKRKLVAGKLVNEESNLDFAFLDLNTSQVAARIPLDGYSNPVIAVSDDEKYIASDGTGKIVLINAESNSLVATIDVTGKETYSMNFSSDGKSLGVVSRDNIFRVYNSANGQKSKEVAKLDQVPTATFNMVMSLCPVAFSPDKKTVALGYQMLTNLGSTYRIGFFKTSDYSKKNHFDGMSKGCLTLFTDADENRLVVGNISAPLGTRLWNLKKGEIDYFFEGSAYSQAINGKLAFLYMNGTDKKIRLFDFKDMKSILDIPVEGYIEPVLSPDGKFVGGLVISTNKTGMPEYNLKTWSVSDGKQLSSSKYEVTTFPKYIDFSKGNKMMAVFPERVDAIDPTTGKITKSTPLGDTDFPFKEQYEFLSENTLMFGSQQDTSLVIKTFDILSGEIQILTTLPYNAIAQHIRFNADRSLVAMAILDPYDQKPFKVIVINWADKKVVCEMKDHTSFVTRVCFGPKTNNVYSADNNGVISVWNLKDCVKKSSFLSMNQRDFMIITPDNYYRSSSGNLDGVGFRYRGKLYRFDQFDMVYNRPDLVLSQLGFAEPAQINLYKEAYKKRLKRMGFSEDRISAGKLKAPEVAIVDVDAIPSSVAMENYAFTIQAIDSGYKLDRMHVYINNVPVYGKRGFDVRATGSKTLNKKIDVILNEGKNVVQVSVMNENGIESIRETFGISCDAKKSKPNLYVISVGAKSYADSSMNLTYSDKDAEDIASVFFTSAGTQKPPYTRVFTKTIINKEVTVENVKALKAFLKDSKVDDQVVLFFSGHGLLSANMDYYLAMYDVDFAHPENRGLSYEDFQNIIDSIPARKRLILLDACHSGELDKDEVSTVTNKTADGEKMESKEFATKGKKVIGMKNTNELMKELFTDLRKESGATVISSSSGKEFSLEGKEWKNGVFTYSLKLGLSSMKADKDKNNEVQISELREFISTKVKELTNGNQNPTSRQENIEFDVRIW